jgi:serine/threonine protein kinase
MQSQGVMHRDLKLGNILITESENQVKIIDFGLAVKLELGEKGEQKTLCGTPNYISPEVLNSQPYGLQSDLWSLGCILYALLTGTPPFECPSVQDTLMKIKKGKFKLPETMSP